MAQAITTEIRAEDPLWVDDLFRQLEGIEGKAEIVDGGIFLMSPAGAWHTIVSTRIGRLIEQYSQVTGHGIAVSDNGTFRCVLPHRQSFSPDAAYYVGPPARFEPFPVPPVFAVEIRSRDDYGPRAEVRLADKRHDYFAAGTLVVWDIDLRSPQVVRVYRSSHPEEPTIYRDNEQAEAEPALPGWSVRVRDFLPDDWDVEATS